MSELSGYQISHSDQATGCPVTPGPRLSCLDQGIDTFHASIAQMRFEAIKDAGEMFLDRGRQLLHLGHPASTRPAVPLHEQFIGLIDCQRGGEDFTQGFFHFPCLGGLQPQPCQAVHHGALPAGPLTPILEETITAVTQDRDFLDLLPAHVIDGFISQLDDMKAIEGQFGIGQVSGNSLDEGFGHIGAGRRDIAGIATMNFQVIRKALNGRMIATLAGVEQASDLKVVEQGDVVVTSPGGGLIHTHRRDLTEILLAARSPYVVVEHAPNRVITDVEVRRNGVDRHLLAQGDDQCFEQLSKAGLGSSPRRFDLGCFAALLAAHSRQVSMDVSFMLEEVEVTPLSREGVMDGLSFSATRRASKAASSFETDSEVYPTLVWIEFNILDLPRGRQSKGRSEQVGRLH